MKQHFPVALFLWKRPQNTRKILKQIVSYSPEKLLIIVEGPRNFHDKALIDEVINIVDIETKNVVFPVVMDRATVHYGLKKRFTTGFDWIFNQIEEEIIILEDDTIPSDSFFTFAEHCLVTYSEDPDIVVVNGSFRLKDEHPLKKSVRRPFLANFFCAWGWAT